jgi:hypothetical protein
VQLGAHRNVPPIPAHSVDNHFLLLPLIANSTISTTTRTTTIIQFMLSPSALRFGFQVMYDETSGENSCDRRGLEAGQVPAEHRAQAQFRQLMAAFRSQSRDSSDLNCDG